MKYKIGKFIRVLEPVMVGGCISSIWITNSETWRVYLPVILLIHSFSFYTRKI
jgi:hypothetical protein